jgi:outer membrane protein OmpA-like peptidoglycan-associated protein
MATSPAVTAPEVVAPDVVADPEGSAVRAWEFEGAPALKVFFDSGKTQVAPDFADKGVTLVEFLKANSNAKAVISGFNDPKGDPARNAELAKSRAQAVRAALVDLGVAKEQTLLEKAANSTDSSSSNAQARRVEVVIRK